jgi:NTE family protein
VRELLRAAGILAVLDDGTLDAVAQGATTRRLAPGDWLFNEGDEADFLAVVLSGRLEVCVTESTGGPSRRIGPGGTVGELGVLTDRPRSASVRALRDTELAIVPASLFEQVLLAHPQVAVVLARSLASDLRASQPVPSAPRADTVLVFLPAEPGGQAIELGRAVAAALGRNGRRVATLDGADRSSSSAELLDRAEADNELVVLIAADRAGEWASFCERAADRRVLVSDADHRVLEAVDGCDVVVRRAKAGVTVHGVPRARHVASVDRPWSIERLARRLSGRGVGLVLSGGGARGLAHIGVVERLVEAGVHIDRIGGCSMGALVAVSHASGASAADMRSVIKAQFERRWLGDVRIPGAAMLRARSAANAVSRFFAGTILEDLELESFTVSTDLATGVLVVHRTGPAGDAIAASMAVPGLFPPVRHDGHVLVDGGVLDNLPVDVMADAEPGPVIAVDVMRRWTADGRAPGVVDAIARSMVVGGQQRTEVNRSRADVLLSPEVAGVGFLDFDRMETAVEAGRRAADAALEEMDQLGVGAGR